MKYSILPAYNSIVRKGQSYDDGVEKFNSIIKTVVLIGQVAIFFFLYQRAWDFGARYFGLALGPAIGGGLCVVIYGVGCALDEHLKSRITTISTISWLHYKGSLSLVESLGTSREEALAALLVSGFLGLKHEHIETTDREPFKMAEWLAGVFYTKSNLSNSHNGQTLNGSYDSSNGENR